MPINKIARDQVIRLHLLVMAARDKSMFPVPSAVPMTLLSEHLNLCD